MDLTAGQYAAPLPTASPRHRVRERQSRFRAAAARQEEVEISMSIGRPFHIIHMTDDVHGLERWYDDVFDVKEFLPHAHSPAEKRDASLVLLGDAVIEPLAPAFRVEGWDSTPLGRFYKRFGPRWHSIAWFTDDVAEIWQRCTDAGVRVLSGSGGYAETPPDTDGIIMTHPKDTMTQLQFMGHRESMDCRDPRLRPDWDRDWWIANHPIKTRGLAYLTVLTRDRQRAEWVYVDVLGGSVVDRSSSSLTGTDDTYVLLGETVVQLSTPNAEGTLASRDLAAHNDCFHAATFLVEDVDATEEFLTSKGVATLVRDDRTLITYPESTFGAAYRWTTAALV